MGDVIMTVAWNGSEFESKKKEKDSCKGSYDGSTAVEKGYS